MTFIWQAITLSCGPVRLDDEAITSGGIMMKISWNEQTPRKIQHFPNPDYPSDNPDLEDVLTSADVDHVAQIFQTPLTVSCK